ncbi:MAG: RNA polymerase sigma factor [Planctomycetes bacterium]|nr:RNA polymerase sigma factor [Planctomycetota bacterium]
MALLDRDALLSQIPRLFRVALRIVGHHHAAEDVVQEVCVKILEQKSGFRWNGETPPISWLHRVTVNCAIDRVRRENLEERSRSVIDGATFREPPPGPDQIAEQNELAQRALAQVANLPNDCRLSFILTQLDGYSYDEAAEIEAKPRGTVASRVARAKALLLAALSETNREPAGRNSETGRTSPDRSAHSMKSELLNASEEGRHDS